MTDLHNAQQLVLKSWRIIDAAGGRDIEWLFTEAGVIHFGTAANRGREEIRLVYEQRRRRGDRASRHLVANVLWSIEGDAYVAEYSLILFAADGELPALTAAPIGVFDVRDVIVESDGEARIDERSLTPVFTDPSAGLAVSFDKSAKAATR